MGSRRGPLRLAGQPLLALAVVALAPACASLPPPGLDLQQAGLVANQAAPALLLDGLPGGKASGTAVGLATGTGSGVLLSGLACVATGPFMALCLATVLPTVTTVGAVTGAAVGAARSETIAAVDSKRELIVAQLAATQYPTQLAEELQRQASADFATSLVLMPASAASAPSGGGADTPGDAKGRLMLDLALTEVGTEGKSEFAVRFVARLKITRSGDPKVLYETSKEVQSDTELTTDVWAAGEAMALRGVIDRCLRQLAHNVLATLIELPRDPKSKARLHSASCDDVPTDWKQVVTR